jgi:hypothetical protein
LSVGRHQPPWISRYIEQIETKQKFSWLKFVREFVVSKTFVLKYYQWGSIAWRKRQKIMCCGDDR